MTTDLNKLTVVELRAELKKHGLPQAGKKAELVERLSSAVENISSEDATKDAANDEQPAEAQPAEAQPAEEQPAEDQLPLKAATPAPETATEVAQEPVAVQDDPIPDAPESGDASLPMESAEAAPTKPEPSNDAVDAPVSTEPISTTTIDVPMENGSNESVAAVTEVVNDVQNRKRRSRTPSIDESVRKRLRPDDPEPRRVGTDVDAESFVPVDNGIAHDQDESMEPQKVDTLPDGANGHDPSVTKDEVMGEKYESRYDYDEPPRESAQDYPTERMQEDAPAEGGYAADERPVVPAIHPATSALYIKNLMRPLRPADVKDHLITLATPPSHEPDMDVVIDFHLDHIRTHALVSFNSISAASRVRSALHDQVWPDERNRKALWVDFIPADKVADWIAREEAEGGGRGKMTRWEVVYEADDDGNMTARLEEGGPETTRPNPRAVAPPTGPASTSIPTGPSQPAGGIQGAPTGPRGRGGRMPPGYPLQGGVTPQEGVRSTRASPSISYRPQSEDVARRRIDNMRSYYTKDKHRDMGPPEDINRYTFENVDSFVDRGKEVFVGIRPPHRERQMRGGGGGGRPSGGRWGGPPPPRFPPRGDRYVGGRNGGGDSFAPRSRLDGAPLPTFDGGGRPGRRGRFGR